jgi:hypothetical protein
MRLRLGGSFSPYLVMSQPFPVVGLVLGVVSVLTAYTTSRLPETGGRRMGEAELMRNPESRGGTV